MMAWMSIAAGFAVAFLAWDLYRRFVADRIAELNDQRRATSRIVSRGELIHGGHHVQVALALTGTAFYYENSDMHASLDLHWVRDVEYDTALGGGTVVKGGRVLRLGCYGRTFEFIIPADVVVRWHTMLPPRRATLRGEFLPQVVAAT